MEIGETLPLFSIIPFVGMLLSIAIVPLVKGEWWEKHELGVAIAWGLVFLIPFAIFYGLEETGIQLIESLVVDYIPFLVLLFGLFVVSGGIHIAGSIAGTTKNNVIMLAIGTFLASFIGTTGAAMLLVRPMIRANSWRKDKKHVFIFFIFLVANMGGCLTPLGDPPLFMGYMRGVPFLWTMEHIWPILLLNAVILLGIFAFIDHRAYLKEDQEARQALIAMQEDKTKIRFEGAINIVFLLIIIAAVYLNGAIPMSGIFDDGTGQSYGITLPGDNHLGVEYFVQIILILIAAGLSWKFTKKETREANEFTWDAIAEVAKLFLGIFITMIPALALLRVNGASLGIDSAWKFFWCTGALSGFLDNTPTYVVFFTCAQSLGASGAGTLALTGGAIAQDILLAVSAGAVFMGALSYIGNAPNFMVKNLAEQAKIKMPSFFGYMAWSFGILVPVFIIDTLIFFI